MNAETIVVAALAAIVLYTLVVVAALRLVIIPELKTKARTRAASPVEPGHDFGGAS